MQDEFSTDGFMLSDDTEETVDTDLDGELGEEAEGGFDDEDEEEADLPDEEEE